MLNKRLNIILGIIAAVLLAAALMQRFALRQYTVEDFKGRSYNDVLRWMEQNSVPENNVVFNYTYSETIPENTVIAQNISPNRKISGSNSLVITLSQGEDPNYRVELIDFSDMNRSEITEWLDDNGITTYQFSTIIDDEREEGSFVSSEPQIGTRITRNEPVTITLSEHDPSPTVAFPDFTGKTREDIQKWADRYDISVNYIYYYDNAERDTYLFSDYPEGTQIEKGGRISVAISNGNNP